jgi:hypothetical protein
VVQEFALAKPLMFLCGATTLERQQTDTISKHARKVSNYASWAPYQDYWHGNETNSSPGHNFRRMTRLHNRTFAASKLNGSWGIEETGEQTTHAVPLEVLCNTTSFEATDPRDKIYSILGLVSSLLPEIRRQTVQVDYHLPDPTAVHTSCLHLDQPVNLSNSTLTASTLIVNS